ncbi:MAG TPA: CoA transferase, partial [Tepidiformaceae bacterium]|nr:CoA transferase [Tepidiformaceae bacterium]
SDGFISVGCLSPQLNAKFRAVTGVHDPRTEPEFDLGADDARERLSALVREAEAVFETKTTAEWIAALKRAGVPCGRFNFPPEALNDPQLLDNGFVVEVEHPLLGPYKTFGPVLQMDATPTRIRRSAPLLDEHTDQVLAQLGFEPRDIAELRALGAIGAQGRPD